MCVCRTCFGNPGSFQMKCLILTIGYNVDNFEKGMRAGVKGSNLVNNKAMCQLENSDIDFTDVTSRLGLLVQSIF